MLINNEAFYRVSDFLSHRTSTTRCIGRFSRMRPADPAGQGRRSAHDQELSQENDLVGDISVAEYLSRLAYEATTIINAEDYGRTIYDLSIRRNLITIGEDMVNIAYEAPVDMAPRSQIEDASGGFSNLLRRAASTQGSRASPRRSRPPSTWPATPTSAPATFPAWQPASKTSTR
jgi:replicative DNA helicase